MIKRIGMSRQPDDVFGPDDDFRKGPIIDITPRKDTGGGVDFGSDEPLIEQILRQGAKGPDRTDQRPSIFDQISKPALLLSAVIAIFFFLFLIWLVSRLF